MLTTQMTLAEAIEQVAGSRPQQLAVVCGEKRITYGELSHNIHIHSQALLELGIRKSERVVILLYPGVEFTYLFFAIATMGAVIIPLNPQLRARSLLKILRDCQPVALVTEAPLPEDEFPLRNIPGLRNLITTGDPHGPYISLNSLLRERNLLYDYPSISPQDLFALLYTSGTTGEPKGTMHTHRSLIAPVVASIKLRELWLHKPNLFTIGQMAKALTRYRARLLRAVGKPQTFLSTTGWSTITGLEVMLQALLMGDQLVVMPRFHPRQALEMVERERVTVLVAIPTAFDMMLKVEGFEKYDTSSLLICGTGGMACPVELAKQIQNKFRCAIHIGFGATETAGGIAATSIADSASQQATSVGKPMPGMEIRIVDGMNRELPVGQVGELVCKSDSLMLGYYHAPEMTSEVIDSEGWYHTGDQAYVDKAGYLYIVGRKKDMIIRGGQNIFPSEIETYLCSHPKIREAVVVGVPGGTGGEIICAFILLKDGVSMDAVEVLEFCRVELEAYKIPDQVRFVTDFPRSETGKPQKYKLVEQMLQEKEDK